MFWMLEQSLQAGHHCHFILPSFASSCSARPPTCLRQNTWIFFCVCDCISTCLQATPCCQSINSVGGNPISHWERPQYRHPERHFCICYFTQQNSLGVLTESILPDNVGNEWLRSDNMQWSMLKFKWAMWMQLLIYKFDSAMFQNSAGFFLFLWLRDGNNSVCIDGDKPPAHTHASNYWGFILGGIRT